METIRTSLNKRYALHKGTLQANGLWMVFDNTTEECSLWFDEDEADHLLSLPESEFVEECDDKLTYSNSH